MGLSLALGAGGGDLGNLVNPISSFPAANYDPKKKIAFLAVIYTHIYMVYIIYDIFML